MKFTIRIIIFILLATTLYSQSPDQPKEQRYIFEQIRMPALPDTVLLCGEQIPLDDAEIRERAEREYFLLLQDPGQVMLYLKRSGKYFPMYEKLLQEAGMPDDLKFLSVAESALYQSRSVKSALGLWQFMEGTGKSMGLQIDKFVDERCHPQKSTEAAIKYLKNGYRMHGSWISTLAGYNMGNFGVSESMKYQNALDYFSLYLNEETSRFVFRILAIKLVMTNPEIHGYYLAEKDYYKPDPTVTIDWPKSITDLSEWAKSQGTSYKNVKMLNPWILGRALPNPQSGKIWEIQIPVDSLKTN
jgi:hypothetical protein